MKLRDKYYFYLVLILFISPLLHCVAVVAQKANYVGLEKNEEFIWDLKYDEEADLEFGNDIGFNTTIFNLNEDVKAWKQIITGIGNEDSYGGDKGVKYHVNQYKSKKRGGENGEDYEWKMDVEDKQYIMTKYQPDNKHIRDYYVDCAIFGALHVATNVDWRKLMKELQEDFGREGEAKYNKEANSIFIHIWEDYKILDEQRWETTDVFIECDYSENGILESYYFTHEDDTILSLSLRKSIWENYWFWSYLMIVICSCIVGLFLFYYVIKKKLLPFQKKKDLVSPTQEKIVLDNSDDKSEPDKIMDLERQILLCRNCEKPNDITSKYCIFCGKPLKS
ncbi:MAG: zinc ribbon domain-containing protein [Promethearchaeota archaeon]|nr:MAG: zinc ribbon domain-containing protein [Candidatus Lokiarchaeota archaeon]